MIIELNSVSFVISQKFLVQQCIEGKVCRPGKLKTQITSFFRKQLMNMNVMSCLNTLFRRSMLFTFCIHMNFSIYDSQCNAKIYQQFDNYLHN